MSSLLSTDQTVRCKEGFISRNKKCYRFFRRADLKFSQAAQDCWNVAHAQLATPLSDAEQEDIEFLIGSFTELRTATFWLMGFYRSFYPGFYSGSNGVMKTLKGNPLADGFGDGVRYVALNLTTSHFEPVTQSQSLPFVCETSGLVEGTDGIEMGLGHADIESYGLELTKKASVSLQHCAAFCHGYRTWNDSVSLVPHVALSPRFCYCLPEDLSNLTWVKDNSNNNDDDDECSGQLLQMCGDADGGTNYYATVYNLEAIPPDYLQHSCDEFFKYGANQMDVLVMADGEEVVRCFQMSVKSEFVLGDPNNRAYQSSKTDTGNPL